MYTPMRQLSIASLLALYSAVAAAADPWECGIQPDGLWECVSTTTTSTIETGIPAATTDAPAAPADEPPATESAETPATTPPSAIAAPSAPAAEPAETPPAPQPAPATTPAVTPAAPVTDTPLFPTTIREIGTAPASAPDSPAESAPVTEPAETPPAPQSAPAEVPPTPPGGSPLFPTTAPETDTPAVIVPDSPAEPAPATEPLGGVMSETPDATESAVVTTEAAPLPDNNVPDNEVTPSTEQTAVATALTTATDAIDSSIDEQRQSSRWARCPPVQHRSVETPTSETGTIELQADNAQSREGNIFTLEGDAVALMDWKRLEADRITYHQDEGRIDATGNLLYTSPEVLVDGDRGTFYPDTDTGDITQASYTLPEMHARGIASAMELDGRDQQTMKDVSYTTCPINSTDWEIFAKQVDLDQEDGTGTARHAKVELKGVPVLYSPYLSFPLDDRRKSGLLVPKVGTTEATGVDISLPYYWNIAPNKDATIVPRYMSNSGVMLGGEFRYRGNWHGEVLTGEYLPSDDDFGDRNRYLLGFNHKGQPLPRLETAIRASKVSDDFYFDDFGTNLVETSQSNLERTATAAYHGRGWNLGVMAQNFQTIDPTIRDENRPYEQLPTVVLDLAPARRLLGLKFVADAEANKFKHSGNVLVEGNRFDIQPGLSLPVNRPGWYVDPSVSVRYTTYNLDKNAVDDNDNPSRTTPVVSLDAGSFFERTSRWGNTDFVQTLEPRLFYLYVPYKDQDDIPVFDTGEYDFNFWTLFRENRFSGPDRMGDANQLALALTSRFLNPASGVQNLSVSIGSLLYFRDREVTLPGEPVETSSSSSIIGELTLGLTRNWNARAETQWNPQESQSELNSVHLQYRKGGRQLVNLAYRYRRSIEEQTDISMLWPLGNSWHLVGRWNYSLRDKVTLDALAGLGYESCCWTAQLVGRSFVRSLLTRQQAIFLQLELKGLGRLVNTVDKALERGILGYDSID
jgi:LPS-assembly protein